MYCCDGCKMIAHRIRKKARTADPSAKPALIPVSDYYQFVDFASRYGGLGAWDENNPRKVGEAMSRAIASFERVKP